MCIINEVIRKNKIRKITLIIYKQLQPSAARE